MAGDHLDKSDRPNKRQKTTDERVTTGATQNGGSTSDPDTKNYVHDTITEGVGNHKYHVNGANVLRPPIQSSANSPKSDMCDSVGR
jgi:hypothetical protein